MNRAFVKEVKRGKVRLWIMKEGDMYGVYFYHENFPLPIDKEMAKDLQAAETICQEYLYPELDNEILAV